MGKKVILITICIAISIIMYSAPTPAKSFEQCNPATKSALATASAIVTVPYFTVKMGCAFIGTLTAGALNFFSMRYAEPTAEKIAFKSAGGHWYVTPDNLLGEKPLQFIGPVE